MHRDRWLLALILATIFGGLASHADQPIVENYVGRQIPTAMVARNLDRGSGFLHPTLDTAPFPNRFLVEPPIYAQMVSWVRSSIGFVRELISEPPVGFVWERSGRLTSAVLTTLGAWSFYGLVRRRDGPIVALVALASFGIFPVMIRYGRAFQPDAAMLGFVLLGIRGWDQYQAEGGRRWAWLGGLALAMGLTIKITSAWVLIPWFLMVARLSTPSRLAIGLAMLIPAFAWYLYAWGELATGRVDLDGSGGSLASAHNAAIWMRTLSPVGWVRSATWEAVLRNLTVRAFTPLGFVLGLAGWLLVRPRLQPDQLWLGWGIGCGLAILALAAKWHHGYYWMAVAPLAALGVARALVALWDRGMTGQFSTLALGLTLMTLSAQQPMATWRTPPEWDLVRESSSRIAAIVPPGSLLIAPEAVLYYADRAGFRLEFNPEAARRAAGEWGTRIAGDSTMIGPMSLVDFYAIRHDAGHPEARFSSPAEWSQGGFPPRFVADVGPVAGDARRAIWRAALRIRPRTRILIDEPFLIVAKFDGEIP